MKNRLYIFCALLVLLPFSANSGQHVPTLDELLNVRSLGSPRISPDGKLVAYTVTETDWKQDAFVTQIWLIKTSGGKPFQLTRGEKSAGNLQWSPDGELLSFTSNRIGDKSQLFAIRPDGGEAQQLTKTENGVNAYAWSHDSKNIAYTSNDNDAKAAKERSDYLGGFEVARKEYSFAQLWRFEVDKALRETTLGTQLTKGKEYTVGDFEWSPDDKRIAFSAAVNSDIVNIGTSDIYTLSIDNNAVKKLVATPGPDVSPHWSPDGKQIVFTSSMGNKTFFHANNRLALVATEGGTPRSLTDSFDEQPSFIEWNINGLYFSGAQKTASHLFRLDTVSTRITRISSPDALIASAFSFSKDGKKIAYSSASPTSLAELYVGSSNNFAPQKLTSMTEQLKDFTLATREVISWKSEDGVPIEGVLIKPANFDPSKKYPLLMVIHGGPTAIDRPTLLDARYYPADIWAAKGALVLKVNYRGSAGYGEKFRQLNVRNLGVGDAMDVLSGIDYLNSKGWVDLEKLASMGWSQGGYISAFLSTSSKRFKAISVGAGISNWSTYYYNTDITPFTLQYLGENPVNDPDIYRKTSPMTYIKQAKTPTLIQHGELDKRVPIANAFELRQGLEDQGVPVEMVIYKGFGHPINKPKAMRAVMLHNLNWFNHYIFGEPLSDFSKPEIPKKVEETKEATK
jgi:dipeptidyl aminopeptidase/acylaminoacyl peptidase